MPPSPWTRNTKATSPPNPKPHPKGWGFLSFGRTTMSITNTKSHQSITNPCTLWKCGPRDLLEIELGARYRQALLTMTSDDDGDTDTMTVDTLEAEADAYQSKYGRHDLHDELVSAKEELAMQMQLLTAVRYTIEEPRQTPSGGWYFHQRKPKPGDLVMVPSWFVGTGRDEAEPEEERIGKVRADEEAQFRSPRNDPDDTHGEWLTLGHVMDSSNLTNLGYIARLADRIGKSRWEAALTVLREYGDIQMDGNVRRMCAERGIQWHDLLTLAACDSVKKKPRFKPGFLHLVCKGIRVWVEVDHKTYAAQNYRVSQWHDIPENPIAD